MQVARLADGLGPAAVRLWKECGLIRPWNDPVQDLDRALGGPSSTVLGAVDEGELVGTVMVGDDGHRGWLYYLAVAPDRRGCGLGRTLVGAAERWLADRGAPKVQLMVRGGNEAVLVFYERLGYEAADVVVWAGGWTAEPLWTPHPSDHRAVRPRSPTETTRSGGGGR